jgi:TolB-like protein
VIVEEGDIFGDGVNVAARLETLAEPGGICVSRVVRDQVRDKLDFAFEDMGEQSVKNIARPVRMYALRSVAVDNPPASRVVQRRRRDAAPAMAFTAAALIIPVAAWWGWSALRNPGIGSAEVAVAAASPAPRLVAPRLSIVVLPFANLGNDQEQEYFADAITEDLTTDLSRIAHMFVISRSSAFTYKNKPINAKQIGRELGVRYVLEGSTQQSAKQIRINVQLIAADTAAHLWAERFDRDLGDLFALQDDITRGIANALNAQLIAAEAARPTEHPDALDYILRGRAAVGKGWTRENYQRAISFFEQALTLNPRSAEAQTWLANVLVARVFNEQTDSVAADLTRADELVEGSLAASPGYALAHHVKGNILRIQGRCPEAMPEFERAIAINPNLASAYGNLGRCKFLTGSIDEVIPLEELAVRLSPRDPYVGTLYTRIGTVHLLQSRTEEALVWFKKALLPARPSLRGVHLFLASAYALKDEPERAAFELAEARRLSGGDTLSIAWVKANLSRPETSWSYAVPKIRALYETTFYAGLRKAGMPEE